MEVDPATEVIPALGAKEAIANLNLALLDPGDVALASDPGYPVYTTGPLLAGAEPVPLPLVPELGFQPDLDAVPADVAARARLMFLNYPNNPTGAVVDDDLFARVGRLRPPPRPGRRARQRLLGDHLRRLPRARRSSRRRGRRRSGSRSSRSPRPTT